MQETIGYYREVVALCIIIIMGHFVGKGPFG